MDPNFTPEITSPTLSTNEGVVHNVKEFSDILTLDLTDDEIARAFKIIVSAITKWQRIFRDKIDPSNIRTYKEVEDILKDVEQFEDEIKTRLMEEMDLLVSVDVMPVMEGTGYPTIVLEGALPSHYSADYGFDHERKQYEVRKAKEKGEPFLGASHID